ncbi:MAG TPA: glycosyltransferase family 2 protein [Methylocella sp.]|nr:glycosyltransferase family 2 protein [Methylocella sp.]
MDAATGWQARIETNVADVPPAEQRPNRRELGEIETNPSLPLVSVIVINYNYRRFLRAAVDSVLSQTYPNVECIVVDNASTDGSPAVLSLMETNGAGVKIIRRTHNGGQSQAALDGLEASSGPYVIFLDADDLLLPNCVETHVFVHLSLRIHVGFTSGDMLQLSGDQIVLGTEHAFNRRILRGRGFKPRAARPYRHAFGEQWPRQSVDEKILKSIYFVGLTSQWVWAPTSGNCFRRDALDLFADNPALPSLRTGTDLYFCLGINAVSGSVLIDAPVAAYRLHGGNIYSQRPQLNNVLCYQPGCAGDSNALARAALADHLVERAGRFVERGWIWISFLWLLWRMDCASPGPEAKPWARRSRVAAAIVKNYTDFSKLVGTTPARVWLALRLVPFPVIFSLGGR